MTLKPTLLIGLLASFCLGGDPLAAQRRLELVGHDKSQPIRDLAFSPDGALLASCSNDGTARIWATDTGELVATLDHEGEVHEAVFSPEGSILATAHSFRSGGGQATGGVMLWDVQTWAGTPLTNLVDGHPWRVDALAFSPDGRWFVTATMTGDGGISSGVRLWDRRRSMHVRSLGDSEEILDLEFSPDGNHLAAVGSYGGLNVTKGAVLLWRTASFDDPVKLRNDGRNFTARFFPDGRFLAVATGPKRLGRPARGPTLVNLWKVEQPKRIRTLMRPAEEIESLSLSPDGRLLAASYALLIDQERTAGEVVQVWSLTTGANRIVERNTHSLSVQFSPAGGVLATSFSKPHPGVRLWDTDSGNLLATLEHGDPPDLVAGIKYSPQGDKLAVANLSRSGKELLSLWLLEDPLLVQEDD